MPDETHGERIARLEERHVSLAGQHEDLERVVTRFCEKVDQDREAHAEMHRTQAAQDTEDRRRIHRRIDDEVAAAKTAAATAAQEAIEAHLRDAKTFGRGMKWGLLLAGGGSALGLVKLVESLGKAFGGGHAP